MSYYQWEIKDNNGDCRGILDCPFEADKYIALLERVEPDNTFVTVEVKAYGIHPLENKYV